MLVLLGGGALLIVVTVVAAAAVFRWIDNGGLARRLRAARDSESGLSEAVVNSIMIGGGAVVALALVFAVRGIVLDRTGDIEDEEVPGYCVVNATGEVKLKGTAACVAGETQLGG